MCKVCNVSGMNMQLCMCVVCTGTGPFLYIKDVRITIMIIFQIPFSIPFIIH